MTDNNFKQNKKIEKVKIINYSKETKISIIYLDSIEQ